MTERGVLFSSLLFSVLLITSCEKDQLSAPGVVPEEAEIEQGVSDPLLNEGMIQLGKQLENPYSVENMRLAVNINQGSSYSTTRPNDVISGYSFRVLEQDVLRRTFGFSSLKERLNLFKPSGITDAQVDELVDFYSEF